MLDLNATYEDLLAQKLANVPEQDRRQTSMIYQATAANTLETTQMLFTLQNYENLMFADTAPRELLIRRAAERGLKPYPSTYAIRQAEFNIDVPLYSRFSLNELNYVITEKISDGIFKAQCETAGEVGNYEAGTLIPIEYIPNLTTAQLTDVLIPGEDEEDTESFRKRYFDSFESISFGGNRADYKQRVKALPGVGGVRVYRAKHGPGTVGLTVINSIYEKPTQELIDTLQDLIDPLDNQGEGLGLAPIDHIVTVSAVNEEVVNINTNVTLMSGWTFNDIESSIQNVVDSYFKELAETWANSNAKQEDDTGLVVRISQLETRILGVEGVLDIANTQLNGVASNFQLDKEAIPKRGVITNV